MYTVQKNMDEFYAKAGEKIPDKNKVKDSVNSFMEKFWHIYNFLVQVTKMNEVRLGQWEKYGVLTKKSKNVSAEHTKAPNKLIPPPNTSMTRSSSRFHGTNRNNQTARRLDGGQGTLDRIFYLVFQRRGCLISGQYCSRPVSNIK